MQGIAAITAQNGWAMAATGAAIVILGLAVLSFIISQLHRIILLFEKKDAAEPEKKEDTATPPQVLTDDVDPLSDLAETASQYQALTAHIGGSFGLSQLYQALEAAKAPHPHITVRELKAAGYLEPTDEGNFCWKAH